MLGLPCERFLHPIIKSVHGTDIRLSVRRPCLWIIGGTGDSIVIATKLAEQGIACLVTVTTEAARRSYPCSPNLQVRVGALAGALLPAFIQQEGIEGILDASHPFAVEISQSAIAAAQSCQIPYWRYERPKTQPTIDAPITCVSTLEAVLTDEIIADQRVLLILGYRWLAQFAPWQNRGTLFARILPSQTALQAALDAGFTPDRLIALRPPITPELEMALWQQWNITTVITKASGQAGGETTKREVAKALNIPLVMIQRPEMAYPNQYQCHGQLTEMVQKWWHSVASLNRDRIFRPQSN